MKRQDIESQARLVGESMKSKRLPLFLCAVGGLLGFPAIVWVAGSTARLNDEDVSRVVEPLARIHLAEVTLKPLSVTFVVPTTTHWMRVRQAWGEPDFVLVAFNPGRQLALCLPTMPLRFELRSSTGRSFALQPSFPPYGFSDDCESSCLRFRAVVGDKLTLTVVTTREVTISAFSGDLIVVGDWAHQKDKLVGMSLERDLDSLANWLLYAGALFVCSGVAVFVRRYVLHRRDD